MWRFMLIAFLPGLAFAGSVEEQTDGCMFKTEAAEMRDCLSDAYYRMGTQLDDRIASVAYGSGFNDLQSDVVASKLESAQTAWRIETDKRCRTRETIAREICKLSSLEVREEQLSLELDRIVREYGG